MCKTCSFAHKGQRKLALWHCACAASKWLSTTGRGNKNILKPKTALTLAALGCLAACGATSTVPEVAGYGAAPPLPEPTKSLVTTVNIAPARGFDTNDRPEAVGGFAVNAFARDLDHPRWIYVLPNGDVLVAEADAPAVHDQTGGPITRLVSWVRKQVMKRAGAGVPSPNKIILLRAARCERGHRRPDQDSSSRWVEFALRYGLGRQRSVRSGHRRVASFPVHTGRNNDHVTRRESRRPTSRTD